MCVTSKGSITEHKQIDADVERQIDSMFKGYGEVAQFIYQWNGYNTIADLTVKYANVFHAEACEMDLATKVPEIAGYTITLVDQFPFSHA